MAIDPINRARGQSLIETLVTVLFISIGIIALMRFQTYLAYDNTLSLQKVDATFLASKQLESLRDIHVLNNTAGYTSYQGIASGTATATSANTTFTITTTVASFTNPTYKTLRVVVSWTDRNNSAQSVELDSRVAGIEPSNSASVM